MGIPETMACRMLVFLRSFRPIGCLADLFKLDFSTGLYCDLPRPLIKILFFGSLWLYYNLKKEFLRR